MFVTPSLYPYIYLMNGFDIPPPIIISSARFSILRINSILSETFDPPKMTRTGFFGFYKNPPKYSSYFCIKRPATLYLCAMPTTLLWALWADPNASFT
jgi:hypothetical protein